MTYRSSSPHARLARIAQIEAMGATLMHSVEPGATDHSFPAAGADVAEPDPTERVAADPPVIDTERDPSYRDRVQHDPMVKWNELLSKVPRGSHLRGTTFDALALAAEHARRARLSRWQAQR